jgi:nucleotide-binding universal stress UspA family protein
VRFEDIVRSIRADAKKEMDAVERELKGNGFIVKVKIERGIPFQIILRVEHEEDVSAIVIGSHGKSNIKEMLLGSVSEAVIRKSKKPVLVVKR